MSERVAGAGNAMCMPRLEGKVKKRAKRHLNVTFPRL
jgi:hypothetical protein